MGDRIDLDLKFRPRLYREAVREDLDFGPTGSESEGAGVREALPTAGRRVRVPAALPRAEAARLRVEPRFPDARPDLAFAALSLRFAIDGPLASLVVFIGTTGLDEATSFLHVGR